MRASDRGPLPQELQRRFLKQVLRVIGLDSEPGAGIGDQPGPPLVVEQYGLRDLARTWRGDFRFHRVLWFSVSILLRQAVACHLMAGGIRTMPFVVRILISLGEAPAASMSCGHPAMARSLLLPCA